MYRSAGIHRSEGKVVIHWRAPIRPLKAPIHLIEGTNSTLAEHQFITWEALSSRTPFGSDGNTAPALNGIDWIHRASQPSHRLNNSSFDQHQVTHPLEGFKMRGDEEIHAANEQQRRKNEALEMGEQIVQLMDVDDEFEADYGDGDDELEGGTGRRFMGCL